MWGNPQGVSEAATVLMCSVYTRGSVAMHINKTSCVPTASWTVPTNPNGRCTLFTSLKIRNENSWQHFYHLLLLDYQLMEIQCHTCCLMLLACPLNGFPHPSCYVPNGKPAQPNGVQPLITVHSVGKIIDHLKARLILSVPQQEKKKLHPWNKNGGQHGWNGCSRRTGCNLQK